MTIEKLSTIQYDAIMTSISHSKDAITQNIFIDLYGDNPNGYTNESLLTALNDVEDIILKANMPNLRKSAIELGRKFAQVCDYNGFTILCALHEALTESNYHAEAKKVNELVAEYIPF